MQSLDSPHLLVLAQAAVIGLFGGVGLALTSIYSRRGPMIYPVYAATIAAITLLLARHASLSFGARFVAGFVGFMVSNAVFYPVVGILAQRGRRELVSQGRLPAAALKRRVGFLGHSWRIGFLVAMGAIVAGAMAFVSA
jgi:hypothetical protein